MFVIRSFKQEDLLEVYDLFYNAVRQINIKDYTAEQVAAWAPEEPDVERWRNLLLNNHTFIAEDNDLQKIIGFADLSDDGCIDHLYIHPDYQARGVGLRLINAIEQHARDIGLKRLYADVSITAKSAMIFKGYTIDYEETVELKGVAFRRFRMSKVL